MSFLDNIGKAAQAAAKKSGELVEVTKLNMNINSEEDKIQKVFTQIGKMVYEKSKSGENLPEYKELCDSVKSHDETITSLKQKIFEVKKIKLCVSCGAEMESIALFCVKCGSKQPETVTTQQEQPAAGIVCPACGAALAEGSAFCTKCGAKIG